MITADATGVAEDRGYVIEKTLYGVCTVVGMSTDAEDKSGEPVDEAVENYLPSNEG